MQEKNITTNAASDQTVISICEPKSDTDPDGNAREFLKKAVKILLEWKKYSGEHL
jgi:hypothetical protein